MCDRLTIEEEDAMIPIDREQVRLLEQRLRGIGVDRRTFLRLTAAGLAAPAAGSLLAACGGSDGGTDPTATSAAPAATTAGGEEATATTGTSGAAAGSPTTATAPQATATRQPEQASPTTGSASGEVDAEQIFHVIGARQEPASHDFNADLYSGGVAQIWMGLSTYDENFTPIPGWAESWEPNEDASVWTYKLRKDNTGFSNGDPVTAETFVYSWRRMLLPETKAPYASILFDIKNAEEINTAGADPTTVGARAIDDWTREVEMIGPRGMFPIIAGYVACVPTHPDSVEAGNYSTDPKDGPVVSNGPWTLTEW
jgi:ABC-type transport system substrate-binding protein